MAIDEDTRATIVRLHWAKGWWVGAIARHCGVHHSTVTRVLRGAGGAVRIETNGSSPHWYGATRSRGP